LAITRRKHSRTRKRLYDNPRIDSALKPALRKIGVPEQSPFQPDPFQLQALELCQSYDVLVSAPTGSGKTWIAIQAIHKMLSRDKRVWYASPLKALSNSIYQDFCHEFGHSYCGIITGDRKENPDAPVIVGTTEILRNQLYDSMHEGVSIATDMVVMDEAHYLSDPDRGVVWEEVLIYLPSRVRLLLLSATISNAEEIADWLKQIRGTEAKVVRAEDRPVPLEMLFLFPDGLITPLGGKKGLNPKVKKFIASGGSKWRRSSRKVDLGGIVKILRQFDLLPAIFFLKSRMECDRALLSCPAVKGKEDIKEILGNEVRSFLKSYPHLQRHRQMKYLLESLVASHHGGQLPYWKVLVEKMMNKGYLEAIFSTSTVAAGVNFPARTVVLVQSDRYNGREFVELSATDLHQMIGRAGRRGKDQIGFALVVPGLHQDPQLIFELKDSPPEPINSQIHINFSMVLNLLLSHKPKEIKALLEQSFATYQQRRYGSYLKDQWERLINELRNILPKGRCDTADPYEIIENIQRRSDILRETRQLDRALRYERKFQTLRPYLIRGRLFLHKNGSLYALYDTMPEDGRFMCLAYNLGKTKTVRKKSLRLRRVDINQIKYIFDQRVEVSNELSKDKLRSIFETIDRESLEPLEVTADSGTDPESQGRELLSNATSGLAKMPCEACEHYRTCHYARKGALRRLLKEFRDLAMELDRIEGGLWLSFKRHLRFLKETGFVDEMDSLTSDGVWASKLRLDQPLLIAEAIRKGAFQGLLPELLAGAIAPFVWDRVQEIEMTVREGLDLSGMEEIFGRVINSISAMRTLKARRGFDSPPLVFWPAAALYLWAKGVSWDQLLSFVAVDEGDLASLIMRTADHLRQVASLKDTHSDLADTALKSIELILREPVYII